VQGPIAPVHRDHRRRTGPQIGGGLVQLLQGLGREDAPFGAQERLKLRRQAGVASIRARARIDENGDGGQSLPSASSPGASSVSPGASSPSPSAAVPWATSEILGYQLSNTSTICRACFSFEMLNDDCLR
jgi:hypothetical protein